jgi:hypothetical protein
MKVNIDNAHSIDLDDSFSLSDHVIKTTISANKVTMQLLSKGTNGEITLQYMGTKVLKFNLFLLD